MSTNFPNNGTYPYYPPNYAYPNGPYNRGDSLHLPVQNNDYLLNPHNSSIQNTSNNANYPHPSPTLGNSLGMIHLPDNASYTEHNGEIN